jgi:uncharacterized protein
MTTERASASNSTFPLIGEWQLVPEGGIIHRDDRTAVIADVHLGYEWARGLAGDCVPAHSLAETLAKLDSMLNRGPIERLIVAGDLVESARPCARTAAELEQLGRWLQARDVPLEVLSGNHDRGLASLISPGFIQSGSGAAIGSRREIAGWTVAHGHLPTPARRLITGHHHPVLRLSSHSAPCFLAGESRIILPAFSENAAGLDILTGRVPPAWRRLALRAFVSTGADVLDFGPLESLSFRLASALSRSSVLPGNTHRLTHSNLDRTVEQA